MIGELADQVIAEPHSAEAGSETLPRMSSSAVSVRSSVSRATDSASWNCAGTVMVISRVAVSRPLVSFAVSVAVRRRLVERRSGDDARRGHDAGLELVQVIAEPPLVPNFGRSMFLTIALVSPRSIAAASSRTPATPGGSARAIASSSEIGRS